MDSVHYSPPNTPEVYEYDVHNYFSLFQTKSTHEYLQNISNLTFILSRATIPGSNKYTAHWLGDNEASWPWLKLSISGIMTFNLFGIPMTGADICGFNLHTTVELCSRWMQLGALYPFSRNHNHMDFKSQEPYALGPLVADISRIALKLRYSLLKFYYGLFIEKKGVGTVFRPVFYEFPTDQVFFDTSKPYTDVQFMLGKSIMVTPVVEPIVEEITSYFPQDDWYDFFNGRLVHSQNDKGSTHQISAPYNSTIPMFIRGGHIVNIQRTSNVSRSDDLDNMYGLVVALQNVTLNDNNNDTKSFKKSMRANGHFMALENFDDKSIIHKCQLTNCMMNVNITFDDIDSIMIVHVKFSSESEDNINNLEKIGIYEINFYGIPYGYLKEGIVFLNGEILETAFIGMKNGFDFPVLYLKNQEIKHGDVLLIENYYDVLNF